jgi:NTP pyrophosphatase (non-canonical NTP hydrolase)
MAPTAPVGQASSTSGRDLARLPSKRPLLTVTVCGSFRRDPETLRHECQELAAEGCLRLSPADLDFVAVDRGFVLAEHDRGRPPHEVEAEHLRSMQRADFVWLHSPGGYIGASAAMELGYARAVGIPVYARSTPRDPALYGLVQVVAGPAQAAQLLRSERPAAASRGLQALQDYYERAAIARGWAEETAEETLDRLRGEVEELSEALVEANRSFADGDVAGDVPHELADVQLYVVHLANVLGLDLATAVITKEAINEERFRRRGGTQAA